MAESKIKFPVSGVELEGRLHKGLSDRGVVISHPHPLYGGDMNNPVVEAVQQAYQDHGHTTLRFNFRGVGASEGHFDDGKGETDDVSGALEYLAALGIAKIDLAGYSFGAWVNARAALTGVGYHKMVMVSPPVAFIDFGDITSIPALGLVLTGSADDIAPAEKVREAMPGWNPDAEFIIIEGADHFYWGFHSDLKTVLGRFLETKS